MIQPVIFQQLLLRWFDRFGRKNLPWQQNKTPYRVWVSEIMLQQTQVATVIPYYQRFMQYFPDVYSLAKASEDEVLHLWAGLGYYSRARNLLKSAKYIVHDLKGQFPNDSVSLQTLPGIGQSTAGAILSIAYNQAQAILDGNVKRVLSRVFKITQPIDDKKVENQLWTLAQSLTTIKRPADYTQAIMDLGASLCARKKPSCTLCPLQKHCLAYQENLVDQIPIKKKAKVLPIKSTSFLIIRKDNQVILYRRPSKGIWGGLFCLPELSGLPDEKKINDYIRERFNLSAKNHITLPYFRHTFTHYHLDIFPIVIVLKKNPAKLIATDREIWYNLDQPESIGLPKPIQTILRSLEHVPSQLCEAKKTSRRISRTPSTRPARQKNL